MGGTREWLLGMQIGTRLFLATHPHPHYQDGTLSPGASLLLLLLLPLCIALPAWPGAFHVVRFTRLAFDYALPLQVKSPKMARGQKNLES